MSYTGGRTWRIISHPEVEEFLAELDQGSAEQVVAALDRLAEKGPQLGRPLVDTLSHTDKLRNLKELRPGSAKRSEIRILFAFNPARAAVLLVAGDKAGEWNKWYRKMIPVAEKRFEDHLEDLW